MPTLAETLRSTQQNQPLVRGAGGQLTSEAPQSLQQLVGTQGLQAAPITPIGVGMIGGNPDQQKMAGTPAQVKAAVSKAQESPEKTLAGTVRRQQARTEATGSEQQAMEKSTDMQNLGQLGDRVNNFINAQRQNLQAQAANAAAVQQQAATSITGNKQAQLTDDKLASARDLLGQLQQDPSNQQLMLQVNQALGYDINTQLDPGQVAQLFESANDAISRGGAQQVADNLTVKGLIDQGNFGYDSNQLSQLLGLPAQQIEGMNVDQLRAEIDRVTQREFTQSETIGQQAQSGLLGQAERGLAQQAGREASATGFRASEADVQKMDQAIQNADQVQFGGQTYKVDDLLKDETISNVIKDYMEAGEDSDYRKQIEQSEPQLVDFIKQHEALLADASGKMQAGAETFRDTQTYNKSLASVPFGGIALSDSIAKAVIPGYGTLQAEKIDPNSVPFLYWAQTRGPTNGAVIANELNAAAQSEPGIADQLVGLDPNELNRLGIDQGPGSRWSMLKQNKQIRQQVQSTNDANTLLQMSFANVGNVNQLNQIVAQNNSMNSIFGQGNKDLSNQLSYVANGDGSLDVGKLKNNITSRAQTPDLKTVANSDFQGYSKQNLANPANPPDVNSTDGAIYKALSGFGADGAISANEIASADWKKMGQLAAGTTGSAAAKSTLDIVRRVQQLANQPGTNIDKGQANAQVDAAKKDYTNSYIDEKIAGGTNFDTVRQLNGLWGNGDMDGGVAMSRWKDAAQLALQQATTNIVGADNQMHGNKDIVEAIIPGFGGQPYGVQEGLTQAIVGSIQKFGPEATWKKIRDMNFNVKNSDLGNNSYSTAEVDRFKQALGI